MKKVMHFLGRLFPSNTRNENVLAVNIFRRIIGFREIFKTLRNNQWPVVTGSYTVGDPGGIVAVCTLSDSDLIKPFSSLPGVAIAGKLYTPNLGIERIVLNIISNPNIRFLLLCGRDSPVFRPAQALQSLFRYGYDNDKRIYNATGHYPVLRNLKSPAIDHFLEQVELIDLSGTGDTEVIQEKIQKLRESERPAYRKHEQINDPSGLGLNLPDKQFAELHPGGKRVPVNYDEKGFFVITMDVSIKQIIVKHYYSDNRPGYIIRGHSAEPIILALINNNLISQLSHAGYLGKELAKAELALKNNMSYEQDRPLKI